MYPRLHRILTVSSPEQPETLTNSILSTHNPTPPQYALSYTTPHSSYTRRTSTSSLTPSSIIYTPDAHFDLSSPTCVHPESYHSSIGNCFNLNVRRPTISPLPPSPTLFFFFLKNPAPPEISPFPLHAALPI